MDARKRLALKTALARRSEPLLVEVGPFFDGNDDEGSIGCNLDPHPGIARFWDTLVSLGQRRDVEAVYVWVRKHWWPLSLKVPHRDTLRISAWAG